tara:strand:+ start:210 stop:500 length:291 start_codon:yes stop_codon:yes gene_type:complete
MNYNLRVLLIIICSIFLLGAKRGTLNLTEQQLRDNQRRIQEIILLSQQTNKQPKPIRDQREARMQQNRYTPTNLMIYPRTVYRELPNVPKQRRFHN